MANLAVQNLSDKALDTYISKKRRWYLLAYPLSLIPVFSILLYLLSEQAWLLIVPMVLSYGLVPLLDHWVGSDTHNPSEDLAAQMEADPFYKWVLFLALPLHFINLVVAAWFVASQSLSPSLFIFFAVMLGVYGGFTINLGHELGHKTGKLQRRLARFALSLTGYGHFTNEHNAGHHVDVSTPEDNASSRMGESIYRFAWREIPSAIKRGWSYEIKRLNKRQLPWWSGSNQILQSYLLTILIQGGLVVMFGWIILPLLLIHNASAWLQLTSANYIEHYGLLRAKKENGRYESCKPYHSWNASHFVSNIVLFHLQRHSDHHANAARPYQTLRCFNDLPELPSGYFGMFIVSYIPWLWFRIMDKRLLSVPHINGDLSKVNLDPKYAHQIRQRYLQTA